MSTNENEIGPNQKKHSPESSYAEHETEDEYLWLDTLEVLGEALEGFGFEIRVGQSGDSKTTYNVHRINDSEVGTFKVEDLDQVLDKLLSATEESSSAQDPASLTEQMPLLGRIARDLNNNPQAKEVGGYVGEFVPAQGGESDRLNLIPLPPYERSYTSDLAITNRYILEISGSLDNDKITLEVPLYSIAIRVIEEKIRALGPLTDGNYDKEKLQEVGEVIDRISKKLGQPLAVAAVLLSASRLTGNIGQVKEYEYYKRLTEELYKINNFTIPNPEDYYKEDDTLKIKISSDGRALPQHNRVWDIFSSLTENKLLGNWERLLAPSSPYARTIHDILRRHYKPKPGPRQPDDFNIPGGTTPEKRLEALSKAFSGASVTPDTVTVRIAYKSLRELLQEQFIRSQT